MAWWDSEGFEEFSVELGLVGEWEDCFVGVYKVAFFCDVEVAYLFVVRGSCREMGTSKQWPK